MKKKCLVCAVALNHDLVAFICSYECTYCSNCADAYKYVCKNCRGELKQRPKRDK